MYRSNNNNPSFICMVCNRKIEANQQLLPQFESNTLAPLPLVCGACKKFYWRNRRGNVKSFGTCSCKMMQSGSHNNNNNGYQTLMPPDDNNSLLCRTCRFQRCEAAILRQQSDFTIAQLSATAMNDEPSGNSSSSSNNNNAAASTSNSSSNHRRTNMQLVPCQVCGASSSGYHFGIISCEGCKGFFRRSLAKHHEYRCTMEASPTCSSLMLGGAGGSNNKHHDRKKCKRCRYDACLAAGMSNSAVRTGRHSMQRRIQTTLFVKQLAAENRLLMNRTFRRRRRKRLSSLDSPMKTNSAPPSEPNNPDSKRTSSASATSSQPDMMVAQPERCRSVPNQQQMIFPKIVKLSNFLASSLPDADRTSPMIVDRTRWFDFRIGDEPFSIDNIAQSAIRALKHLEPLNKMQGRPLRASMSPHEVWNTYMSSCFEPHLHCVLACVRSMPGFSDLAVPDRIKLFSHAYFPILIAQLSVAYDAQRGSVNFLSLPDEESISVLKEFFDDKHDLCYKQLFDAGTGMKALNPMASEFAMLCALLFFNPSLPGLVDPEKVRMLRHAYEYIDSQINGETHEMAVILSPSMMSLATGTNTSKTKRRFTNLTGYFLSTVRLFAQALSNAETTTPHLIHSHPLFAELYTNLSTVLRG